MYSPPFSHITFMIALVLLCIISIAVLALQRNSLSDISANYQHIAFHYIRTI
jgi:Tfp pilus assembly protein PilV